jgi:hypothetical protein
MKELIFRHNVELIVVGANKLEARAIKKTITGIATNLEAYGPS